jgi:hypothetical protein
MEKNNTAFDEIEPRSQIDVMMRTTVQKNTALSSMADQKANILTASSFILLTVLVSRYNELPELATEILVLLVFICISIAFSLISLFPISKSDKLKKTNWLFFGDYNNTSYDDFKENMIDIMKSDGKTYDTLLLEIYQSGVVLGNKFKFIRWSYTSLMSGFIVFLVMIIINRIILN